VVQARVLRKLYASQSPYLFPLIYRRIQLIERFYDPVVGNIFVRDSEPFSSNLFTICSQLDDHRISDLNINAYRRCIALVSQEPVYYLPPVPVSAMSAN